MLRVRFKTTETDDYRPVDCIMDPDTGAYECCRQCDYTGVGNEIGIDWVVAGGESGPHARPSHPDWFRTLRDQCKEAGVQFLFKQWGEWIPGSQSCDIGNQTALIGACQRGHRWDSGAHSWCIGKKAAGRLLDGVPHDEYPEGAA